MSDHGTELARGERYSFGGNWSAFLGQLDDERVEAAVNSLREMLGAESVEGMRLLDIGSGSGLFSLAARKLGAIVHSFDYDPKSVACTRELRRRFFPDDPEWVIEEASVLDPVYMEQLGTFEIVYSWGVLHHTGDMWTAMEHASQRVAPGGRFFIAIYNDQGLQSELWRGIKRTYCSGRVGRTLVSAACFPYFVSGWLVADVLKGKSPVARYTEHKSWRGMSMYYDLHDWLGGYPFEVAKPEGIFAFCDARGFRLDRLTTCGGTSGNNEFVFVRDA